MNNENYCVRFVSFPLNLMDGFSKTRKNCRTTHLNGHDDAESSKTRKTIKNLCGLHPKRENLLLHTTSHVMVTCDDFIQKRISHLDVGCIYCCFASHHICTVWNFIHSALLLTNHGGSFRQQASENCQAVRYEKWKLLPVGMSLDRLMGVESVEVSPPQK